MTLDRLLELYKAERQGKQIMMRVHHSGYYESNEYIEEVKITECDLKNLIFDEQENTSYTFFIEGREDEYGHTL